MDNENNLKFSLLYGTEKKSVNLLKSDKVGTLKGEIHKLYGILPEKQIIDGLDISPASDEDILNNCLQTNSITSLTIKNMDENHSQNTDTEEEIEIEATISFISKIMNKYDNSTIQFHACKLQDAIKEACMVPPLEKRKALCLYLHNSNDKFSSILCENLRRSEIIEIINRNFFFLGYDIEEPQFQSALIEALRQCHDLSTLIPMVESKISAAVCIVPIQDSVTIFSCIRGKVSNKDFLATLSNAENFLIVENQQEKHLEQLREETANENDIGSINYQKLMADMLGDRDWDRFEHDQHEYLKKKIAFALLGPPQKEEGYEKKDLKTVETLYQSIVKSNNEVAKHKGRVEISFMYNCTEPLPSDKMSRAKKYKEYNPNVDVTPLPIFVLRKCRGSADPCRIFVDNIGRTYQTWNEYITKNKFHQCEMILPLNGRYEVNEIGDILLERHLSPACGVDSKLLQGADYLSTAGGIISGGIFVAAAIPTVAVAPAALLAGGIIGLGVGIYSMGRSAYTLYDRKKHKETLTFANSEARGAYLSIVAGSLGFVGVGATVVVSQLTGLGVNIGQGAGAAIKTIGFINVGASGASMINSGYEVIDHWIKENKVVSLLTIMQLKSSVLFFGNVVHNTDSKDMDVAQARTLHTYQESLRNNRLRKQFLVLQKKTFREYKGKDSKSILIVVSPIVKIPTKDNVLAVLSSVSADTEKKTIEVTITNNEIKLNKANIDLTEAVNINERDVSVFLSNYFPSSDITLEDISSMRDIILKTLRNLSLPDLEIFIHYVAKLLHNFSIDTKWKVIIALAFLLLKMTKLVEYTLDEIFYNQSKYFHLFDAILSYFGKTSEKLKDLWKTWLSTRKEDHYLPFFEGIDEEEPDGLKFFEKAVEMNYQESDLTVEAEKELLSYFYNWLAKQVFDNQERLERDWRKQENSASQPTEKVSCNVCGGYFYRLCKKSSIFYSNKN